MPELPHGHFYVGDILAYRSLVSEVPDGGVVVEIGVYKGRSICSVAPECKRRGISLFGVDPYGFTTGGGEMDGDEMFKLVEENLKAFDVLDIVAILRQPSVIAAKGFPDQSIDLVMIDGPHDYDNVLLDIQAWLPKIKPGGMIAGHDYCGKWPGVARAIHETFGPGDYSCNVDDEHYCVMWRKHVGLNVKAGSICKSP